MKRTVIITGASRGIGRSCAMLFAEEGCNVTVNYLNHGRQALDLCEKLGAAGCDALPVKADVSSPEGASTLIDQTLSRFGNIDVLVNNAGIAQQKLFTDITDSDWQRMLAVNVTGVFNCCRAVLPTMIHNKSGRIINVSSVWGIHGASCEVHYSASKAAVIGLTKALAKEVGPSGILVNCVAPGVINTEMNAVLSADDMAALCEETPLGRIGTPEEAARAIVYLAGANASFITGQVLGVGGGFAE
jgi:3-oxoacyl-[acyl-carrier protein] reductase